MIRMINSADADKFIKRSKIRYEKETAIVRQIIADVIERGDEAVFEYTERFDKVRLDPSTIRVSDEEIARAYKEVDGELLDALKRAADNIREYHAKQKPKTWLDIQSGKTVGQLILPLDSVGIYIPGGTASYPSSVLMNAIPASIAGVKRIVMVTPASQGNISPLTLVAAGFAGVKEIYKVGGAQAIAALAYGTRSIPCVDKITGPGNIYVTLAKREIFGRVGIDMTAGPSEILIIADKTANPVFIAADMLSQAEHDSMASAVLVTHDEGIAQETARELQKQLEKLPRIDTARAAIENYGAIILTKDIRESIDVANAIAPEHLELALEDPFGYLGRIRHAGAVFCGHYSPEPLGDYYAGPNHVLPTSGTARFYSVLSVDDFMKKTSVISYSKSELEKARKDITLLAHAEGLTAHASAVDIRFK
ncbi:MAG TPA: histidinol dehydrogenase [Clostridia bacterium]|nr:histidinol dehydrogenase [Clostridia bacterium]